MTTCACDDAGRDRGRAALVGQCETICGLPEVFLSEALDTERYYGMQRRNSLTPVWQWVDV
jgi:hypothetical protein